MQVESSGNIRSLGSLYRERRKACIRRMLQAMLLSSPRPCFISAARTFADTCIPRCHFVELPADNHHVIDFDSFSRCFIAYFFMRHNFCFTLKLSLRDPKNCALTKFENYSDFSGAKI